jgi:molybdopterin synthase catalytic subunit
MRAKAKTTGKPFDTAALYREFTADVTSASGTMVIHHGRVKRPGKQIPDFKDVLLEPLVEAPGAALLEIAETILKSHGLHQAMVVHRLGVIGAGDDVLWAAVSAKSRSEAFKGCEALVDAVKEERVIRLVERG